MMESFYGPLDAAMLTLIQHRESAAFRAMIDYLRECQQSAQDDMLGAEGNELYELKGLAAGLRDMIADLTRTEVAREEHP